MFKTWNSIKEYSPVATEKTDFNGRIKLYTDYTRIDESNIQDVLNDLIFDIYENYRKIKMLKNYEKGLQPILQRNKKVRGDINNRVVVNHAHEIKEFKKGFTFGDPITYIQRARKDIRNAGKNSTLEEQTDIAVAQLNEMMYEQAKNSKDIKLSDEFFTGGVGYRLVTANVNDDNEISSFSIYIPESEYTFVVYANTVERQKVLAGTFVITNTGEVTLGCYTDEKYFELAGSSMGWQILKSEKNGMGIIPIVEYDADEARCGSFERVIKLINAINTVSSDRVNGVAQFIQAILWINNVKVSDEQFNELMVKGCLNTTDVTPDKKATVEWLASELNQSNTQTIIDDFTKEMLEIAGVPGREQSTGGNTGEAIMYSNGWHIAETQAQAFEEIFKQSEQEFLKIVLKIIGNSKNAPKEVKSLSLSDIEIKFNRNRTDNLLVKVQALNGMLTAGVHPSIAFKLCGLFNDSGQAYLDSLPYLDKWKFSLEDDTDMGDEPKGENTEPDSFTASGKNTGKDPIKEQNDNSVSTTA